jgi:type III pantothenate kinase
MILAIDVGNTHIVLGCIEGDEIRHIARISTNLTQTEYEYAALMRQVLDLGGMPVDAFEGAILSCVVPPLTETLCGAIRRVTGRRALVVGAGLKTGLNILIDNPAQLGSDLVVGAVAALAAYPPPIIIFDMGTATTISVLDADGRFLGGAIVPGVGLSLTALVSATAQLPKVPLEAPRRCISSNTIDCMKSGAVFGAASMVDGMVDRMEEELGRKATLLATGGLAGRIVPHCRHSIVCDDDLLLRGLSILYHKNKRP